MRVLQINTVYGTKSTGRTCVEVEKALQIAGYECYTAYGNGYSDIRYAYRIGSKIEYYIHNIMARITGLQGYFSIFATIRFIRYIENLDPDIIHLRNLHANYLNLPLFFRYLKSLNKPVILNLHDCWAFTGKCTHYTDIHCAKWQSQCSNCPAIHDYPQSLFFDRTKKLYKDKKKWFNNIKNLTVIGVSKWTSEQAKMSFLSNRNILTIYNWINRDVFYPRKESDLKEYQIDESKFIILGVSSTWIKGSPKYEDFIMLSKLIPSEMQIVLIGQTDSCNFPQNIKCIPFVKDINELAKLYSTTSVYVHLSTEDTFGKVVAEALACGTPAIVYDSTALPELIEDGCGYIVKPRDVHGVLKSIIKIKENGKSIYANKCITNVANNFDYSKNISKLIELYEAVAKG